MKEKIISVSSYGLFCLSVDSFDSFLKFNKIKTRKLNKYFDKNRDLLEKSMLEGVWIPVSIINSVDYLVEIEHSGSKLFNGEWSEVLNLSGCNLQVGSDGVWVGSLGSIDTWSVDDYKSRDSISYDTMDGETVFKAYKFETNPGKYKVTIRGFKRKAVQEYPEVNLGFLFELQEVDKFEDFTNPLTQNVNIAKM